MNGQVLILRPEPGATETARKAEAMGLEPIVAPLFTIAPVDWKPPPDWSYDAVILTSANAARMGGAALGELLTMACYAVGESTAAAAKDAGFADVHAGPSDAAALVAMMADKGITEALHLCGRDRLALEHSSMRIEPRVVYSSDAVEVLPAGARAALESGALALLHSPRAAGRFAELVDAEGILRDRIRIAAISQAALAAAGPGWKSQAAAPEPRDDALLELAVLLCQTGGKANGMDA